MICWLQCYLRRVKRVDNIVLFLDYVMHANIQPQKNKTKAIILIGGGLFLFVFTFGSLPLLASLAILSIPLGCLALLFLLNLSNWTPMNNRISEQQIVSMVALFQRLPYLDHVILEHMTKQAWGIDFDTNEFPNRSVSGSSPMFLISTDDRIYTVNYFERPYFDRVQDVADEASELRTKSIIQTHQAWISIDLMQPAETIDDLDYEYAQIGKLLSQIVNEDVMAIVIPETMRLIPWSKDSARMLISDAPLTGNFNPEPPVLQVNDYDPKMMRAVNRARRKFPEFVDAFERCMRGEVPEGTLQDFSVKSPVTVGRNTEYIWSNITCIENGIIYGKLCNQPVSLKGLSAGDRVRIRETELNDWIYKDNDEIKGGFTIKVLKSIRQKKTS